MSFGRGGTVLNNDDDDGVMQRNRGNRNFEVGRATGHWRPEDVPASDGRALVPIRGPCNRPTTIRGDMRHGIGRGLGAVLERSPCERPGARTSLRS